MIKVRILRQGDYPRLLKWFQITPGGSKSDKGDVRLGEVGVICFEDGGRGHKPENPGSFSELEEAREQTCTQCLQKEEASQHLDFSAQRLFSDLRPSDL